MTRKLRSVDTDPLKSAGAVYMQQLVVVLQSLRTLASKTAPLSLCHAPTFIGEDLWSSSRMWSPRTAERRTLLRLRGSSEELAQIYSRKEIAEEIYSTLQTKYGLSLSSQRAKERLLTLIRNLQGSVSNFAVEISNLVKHVHPYLSAFERDTLTVEYLSCGFHNKALRNTC